MVRRLVLRGVLASVAATSFMAAAASSALATSCTTTCTWSGATTNNHWSAGGNWAGGSAPGTSVSTLSFPALSACPTTDTCYTSIDDLSGTSSVSAGGISIDDGVPYDISYTGTAGITLGSGGLNASPATNGAGGGPQFLIPITLSAPQTWSIQTGLVGPLTLGKVTGPIGDALTINFTATSRPTRLWLTDDFETGPVSASGSGVINLVGSPFSLNGTSGNSVSLSNRADLVAGFAGSSTGPLDSTGGVLQVGQGSIPDGTLAVNGAGTVTLDQASSLTMFIDQAGTTPSTDYSQLTAGGNVNLGNAALNLVGQSDGTCPTLNLGDVDVLISTSGSLTGTFSGIPDGTVIPLNCQSGTPPDVRINYTAHSVTATAVPASGMTATTTSMSANPTNPVTNQPVTLTASVSSASGTPTGSVEFDDNGSAISGCSSVPVDSSGNATCATRFTAASSPENLTASYAPTLGSQYASSSSSPVVLNVGKDSTSTTVSSSSASPSPGQNVTYTATVTPAHAGYAQPSGTVQFADGGVPITGCASQPVSPGSPSSTATCTTSYGSPGSHSVAATYAGDSNFTGSSSSPQAVTVSTPSPGGGGGGTSGAGSGGPGGGGGTSSSSQPSTGQILAALSAILAPRGRNASIGALLKQGGYTFSFNAPSAGTLVLGWFFVPKGAHFSRAAKPVKLASVTTGLSKSGGAKVKIRLTAAGTRMLKHARTLKVMSKAIFTPSGGAGVSALKAFVLKR